MGHAQNALELVYELRANAMDEIADKMSTALGDAGAAKATAGIASQMQKLLAADVLYETIVRPEIDSVLAEQRDRRRRRAEKRLPPRRTKWLEESTVSAALGAVSGATGAATPGVHGLGLIGVSVNGTELAPKAPTRSRPKKRAEVEVQVENQGESTENGVDVAVTVDGGNTLEGTIEQHRRRRNRRPRRSR